MAGKSVFLYSDSGEGILYGNGDMAHSTEFERLTKKERLWGLETN